MTPLVEALSAATVVAGLIAVALVAAVADWVAVWAGGPWGRTLERFAKPAVMVALLAAAVVWPAEAGSWSEAARPWLLLGLAASLAGDVLLLPPGRFVPGLVAFLVAHLAYLVGFLVGGVTSSWLVVGAITAAAVIRTVGFRIVKAARPSGLGVPVALYMAAILAMAAVATGTHDATAIAGAWLFVTSDSLLGWRRFVGSRSGQDLSDDRRLGVAIMVTYHLAQVLILVALAA